MKKIEIDVEHGSGFNLIFSVKLEDSNHPKTFRISYDKLNDIKEIAKTASGHVISYNPKDIYQSFTKEFEVTPTKFQKMLKAAVWYKLVEPNHDLIEKYAIRNGHRSMKRISEINSCESILRQAQKDGQHNLLPILLAMKKTPQQLKKDFGKGVWKTLCKNSHNQNKVVAEYLEYIKNYLGYDPEVFFVHDYHKLTTGQQQIINRWQLSIPQITPYFKYNTLKNINCCLRRHGRHFFSDILRMSEQLNVRVPNDLFKDVEEYRNLHDNLSRRFYAERALNNGYRNVTVLDFDVSDKYQNSFELNGVKAELIKDSKSLMEEGKSMHHCVGSYNSDVASGRYIVYHLTNGKEKATLGLSKYNGKWTYNQMYHECNREVENQDFHAMSSEIIKELNRSEHAKG